MRERREIAQRARARAWGRRTARWHLYRALLPWGIALGVLAGAGWLLAQADWAALSVSDVSMPSLPDVPWVKVAWVAAVIVGVVVAVKVWRGRSPYRPSLSVRLIRWRLWWRRW
jgi:hypothetical protein